jgi:hypothetical protein
MSGILSTAKSGTDRAFEGSLRAYGAARTRRDCGQANEEIGSHYERGDRMNIRRLVLDVDKAVSRPSVVDIARAIEEFPGVKGVNVTVTEIDIETVGMEVTIEGEHLDYDALVKSIDATGAVVHSVDEVVSGSKIVERVARKR